MSEILKERELRVRPSEGWKEKIRRGLASLPGLKRVHYQQNGTIELRYDLRRVRLEEVEKAIEGIGISLSDGLWSRMKRGLIHYSEQNELDNLTAPEAPCCSNPKLEQ